MSSNPLLRRGKSCGSDHHNCIAPLLSHIRTTTYTPRSRYRPRRSMLRKHFLLLHQQEVQTRLLSARLKLHRRLCVQIHRVPLYTDRRRIIHAYDPTRLLRQAMSRPRLFSLRRRSWWEMLQVWFRVRQGWVCCAQNAKCDPERDDGGAG